MAVMQRDIAYLPAMQRRQARGLQRAGSLVTLTLVALALWVAYTFISSAVAWGQVKLDDIRYGYPRSYQTDGFIGYREANGLPTHFVAINAHRQVLVMIIPGGDPSHVMVIKGPYLFGPGQEFSPVQLNLSDVNHDGYLDLQLHVDGQTVVYLNDPRHHSFRVAHSTQGGVR